MHKMHEAKSGGHMEHGTDKPPHNKGGGKAQNLVDVDDFKGQAMDTAYGQAGMHG